MENTQPQPEKSTKYRLARKAAVAVMAGSAIGASLELASMPTTAYGKEATPKVAMDNSGSGDKYGLVEGGVINFTPKSGKLIDVVVKGPGARGGEAIEVTSESRGGHAQALNPSLNYDNEGHVVPDESHIKPA